MKKTVMVSARVEPWIKELIKNRGHTVRSALEFVAAYLASKVDLYKAEIKVTENEILRLELEHKRLMNKLDAIEFDIKLKEEYINSLNEKLDEMGYNEDALFEEFRPAVDAIYEIALRFKCHPLEVNKFTLTDTIGFHAKKHNISKVLLEEILSMNWKGGN